METSRIKTKNNYRVCFGIVFGIVTAYVVSENLIGYPKNFNKDHKVGATLRKVFISADEATEELYKNFEFDRLETINP
jgi:hypothetical protein